MFFATRFLSILLLAALPGLAEDLLKKARTLAFEKQRTEALALLERRLEAEPEDTDARVFYGTVLSWEGRNDEARQQLQLVLERHPDHGDALVALANVELWSDHPEQADRLMATALERRGNRVDLMYARARALRNLGRSREALEMVNRVLSLAPQHEQAQKARRGLEDDLRHWEAQWSYTHEWFNEALAPWHEAQLALKRALPAGSLIARFSQAHRFGLRSRQAEMDFYPSFRPGTYAFLNLAYSYDAALYPRYRTGADLYQNLGGGFEGSGGFRRLGFGNKVNIYTASLGKYHGDWLWNGRVYLTPDFAGTSRSIVVSARRYFGDGKDYFGLRFGRGASPVETRTLGDIEILNSVSGYAEVQKGLGRRWMFLVRGGASREERIQRGFLQKYLLESNLYFRF